MADPKQQSTELNRDKELPLYIKFQKYITMPARTFEDHKMDPNFGEKVVISGMSGLYPGCLSVKELSHVLYNQVDPITSNDSRWECSHPDLVQRSGHIANSELETFDAQFFKVHFRLGQCMDVLSRKLLEQTYQAIYDAGTAPAQLDGKKIAVYIGMGFSEAELSSFYEDSDKNGFSLLGCAKSMVANRISYWINSKGPSVTINQACCSSIAALEQGVKAIKSGECEAAIVGGTHLCLHPQNLIHYRRMGCLSLDGKTRSFDKNATGFVGSEAINILFLQKAKDAKRCYAEVIYAQTKFTALEQYPIGTKHLYYRNPKNTVKFLEEFYNEANVSPQAVKYIEAFGSGIPEVDKSELEAFDEVFCSERKEPLLVGSIMSNIGYTENASGISAITKVLLGYQTGQLAANLHCKFPREDVTSVCDGRLCIVTENKPFEHSSYAAVNTLSFNGINGHVLLRGFYKPKNLSRYASNIPRLVLISGRQESAVEKMLEDLKSRPLDLEEIALLHNVHESRQPGHLGRGFTILDLNESNETMSLAEKASYFDAATSPLWFVYSGMGSQWPGMGKQLLQIPTFAAAIDKCCAVLKEKKIDLLNIITSADPKIFDNILNSFVGIAAIQIGLTDVLTELGIVPNYIIGHSVGELGCAYADGCLTAQEMILCAYSRGLVSIQNPLIFGSMAAIGLGSKEVQKLLPNEIEIACHNSSTSCTISGPADAVKSFVSNLRSQKIFAKEVPCSNIAYHSRYIANLGPDLLRHLNEIIKTPTLRSKRWLSTSVSQKLWDEPSAMYNSAEYHTNNLLNPVLFEETAELIPPNAVIIEIAPYGLLQAILRRSLPFTKKITITQRGSLDAVKYFLEAIGELYIAGYDPTVKNLYPKIEFPVSTGTPMLSHLVDWAHNEKWKIPSNLLTNKRFAASCEFLISLHDEENKYLRGHQMNDKNVYPFAAALVLVWDTLAMVMGVMKKELSVQFNDVNFYSQPILSEKRNLHLTVSLHRGSGHFEVRDRQAKIIAGFIKIIDKNAQKCNFNNINDNEGRIYCSDIYELLSLKGFNYFDDFQSIQSANMLLTNSQISWRNNWITLIDGLLQLNFLRNTHDSLSKLKFIKRIDIDITKHVSEVISLEDKTKVINAHVNDIGTRCGGIYLNGIELQDIAMKYKDVGTMKVLKFIPHFSKSTFNEETILNIYTQIVSENLNKNNINILRITKNNSKARENDEIRIISETKIKITTTLRNNITDSISLKDVDLVVIENLSTDDEICQTLQRALNPNTFIINKEECTNKKSRPWPFLLYSLVCEHNTNSGRMELIYKRSLTSTVVTNALSVFSPSDLSIFLKIVSNLSPQQNLIVFSSYPPLPKLKDTIRKYRQESNRNISLIMVNNNKSLDQYLDVDRPDLAYNVVYDNVVGGEYYMPTQDAFGEEMMLECKRIGDINSLHWTEIPELAETGVIVKVLYAGLSTVDAKTVAGVITSKTVKQNYYGMEFSGYVERIGTRVMGLVNDGSIKTQLRANPHLLWPVPKHWSLEDAATVPLAYSLAFYCLVIKSRIRHNMKIFVHGGTGALGQAIISIALAFDCEVFTSVSSISKKQFLRRLFPELKGDHICYSRNESFGEVIQNLTKGKGCDIVICTVKAGLKNISLECCGASGITIDSSLLQDQEDYSIGMGFMWHSRSYTTVNLSTIFTREYQDNLLMLQSLLSEGIARGYVRPLARVTYSANDVTNAVRLLACSRHRGRVILDLQPVVKLTTFPRLKCSPNLGHVIISDNDSLGIPFAEKLISRGVKKLHLQWRTPSKLLEFKSRHWQNQGVKIYISYNDVMDGANVLLHISKEIKPIEGLYLLANKQFSNKLENSLKHLLYSSDSYYGLLKYSTIINVDNSTEDNSLDLLYDNQMVTINLPKVKQFAQNKSALYTNCVSAHDTLEAIEYALATKERASSLRWSAKPMTILEYIVSVAGKDVNLIDNTQSTMTLQDLGLEITQAEIIQVFLSDVYNISYCIDDVLHLSIKDIKEIDEEMSNESYKDEDKLGLWAFISNLGPDEIETSSNFVIMPTLTNKSGTICPEDLSVKQKYMCVIPGLEDNHSRFDGICERLKMAALVFHLGCEIPNATITEIAERLVQIIPGNKDKRFYLLGYEYGVLVALEMAAILEDQGFSGLLFCVGGGPEDVLATFNEKLGDLDTNEALQVAVLKHLFTLMVGECTTDVETILKYVSTWEERVKQSVRLLRGRTVYSSLYIQQLIDTTYSRLIHLRQYKYTPRALRSQIISLRSGLTLTDHHRSSLQKHSQKPVVEYSLRKSLANITDDLRCSSIINQHLDKDILDTFDTSNLCDTYFIRASF